MQRPRVIAIRAGPKPVVSGIVRCLKKAGVDHVEVEAGDEVPSALRHGGADAVLVFDGYGGRQAKELLRTLRPHWSDVPVIVVVDKTSFDQYYELMCEGAYDYYEASEGPEVIAEALRWATHTQPPSVLDAAGNSATGYISANAA